MWRAVGIVEQGTTYRMVGEPIGYHLSRGKIPTVWYIDQVEWRSPKRSRHQLRSDVWLSWPEGTALRPPATYWLPIAYGLNVSHDALPSRSSIVKTMYSYLVSISGCDTNGLSLLDHGGMGTVLITDESKYCLNYTYGWPRVYRPPGVRFHLWRLNDRLGYWQGWTFRHMCLWPQFHNWLAHSYNVIFTI